MRTSTQRVRLPVRAMKLGAPLALLATIHRMNHASYAPGSTLQHLAHVLCAEPYAQARHPSKSFALSDLHSYLATALTLAAFRSKTLLRITDTAV